MTRAWVQVPEPQISKPMSRLFRAVQKLGALWGAGGVGIGVLRHKRHRQPHVQTQQEADQIIGGFREPTSLLTTQDPRAQDPDPKVWEANPHKGQPMVWGWRCCSGPQVPRFLLNSEVRGPTLLAPWGGDVPEEA